MPVSNFSHISYFTYGILFTILRIVQHTECVACTRTNMIAIVVEAYGIYKTEIA